MEKILLHYELGLFNADYVKCIDDDRLEAWPDFFTEDCVYRITTADNHRRGLRGALVYADSRNMLRDRVQSLRQANIYERQSYRHFVNMPVVLGEADGVLAVETAFMVARIMRTGQQDLFVTGRYLDRVARDGDGRLKLAERVVVCDSASFDTLVAIPF